MVTAGMPLDMGQVMAFTVTMDQVIYAPPQTDYLAPIPLVQVD